MLHSANKAYVTVLGDGLELLLAAQAMARVNKSVRLLSTRPDRATVCEQQGVPSPTGSEAGLRQDQDAVVGCPVRPGSWRQQLADGPPARESCWSSRPSG